MRTIEEQDVEQVADHIAGIRMNIEWSDEEVRRQNREGWNFDVCYDEQQPYSGSRVTHVTDCSLSEESLVRALELAAAQVAEFERAMADYP